MHRMFRFDLVDGLAIALLSIGLILLAVGLLTESPQYADLLETLMQEWAPGFVIDGLLLLVVNRIIKRNERLRVLAQVGSLSNEFALDAVRRARLEGWLGDGSLIGNNLQRARLADSDLSGADFTRANLRFVDLRNACLNHAKLKGADLTGANLANADLRWADMRDAQLGWADLRDARFEGAITDGMAIGFASIDEDLEQSLGIAGGVNGGHMSPMQIELVGASFAHVEAAGAQAIETFYEKLFTALPSLRSLFSGSEQRQSRKFLQSLRLIVHSLDSPEQNIHVLEQLGQRHIGYGVKPEHYEIAGAALLATSREVLADKFDNETEAAWNAAYSMISSVMIYAANSNR